jgi:hypothetical protein
VTPPCGDDARTTEIVAVEQAIMVVCTVGERDELVDLDEGPSGPNRGARSDARSRNALGGGPSAAPQRYHFVPTLLSAPVP